MTDQSKSTPIEFTVREHYSDGQHLKGREVNIIGSMGVDNHGYSKYSLKRTDTDAEVLPFELDGTELLGKRDFIATSGLGWGIAENIKDALKYMMQGSGYRKSEMKKLEVLRRVTVFECVRDSGAVYQMGSISGLMLKQVDNRLWMTDLHEMIS